MSKAEITALEELISLEALDGWDAKALKEHMGKPVDLDAALAGIEDDVDRRYTLTLCYVMAFVGGITPPETAVLRRVAAKWGFSQETLATCASEGRTLYQRLSLGE